jgi:hypothetical protein
MYVCVLVCVCAVPPLPPLPRERRAPPPPYLQSRRCARPQRPSLRLACDLPSSSSTLRHRLSRLIALRLLVEFLNPARLLSW